MKNILGEIQEIPGVRGVCVVQKGEAVFSEMPDDYSADTIVEIATHFNRLMQIGQTRKMDVSHMEYGFGEDYIMVMPITATSLMLAVFGIQGNRSNIIVTAKMLHEDLRQGLFSLADAATEAEVAAAKIPAATVPEPPVYDVASVISGPLGIPLDNLNKLYAMYIGPIAAAILKRGLQAWISTGEPVAARLPELLEILVQEVNEDDREEFLEKAQRIISL